MAEPRPALRVIVCDNDLEAVALVVMDARLSGLDVVATATDGETAMALCAAERPDVLVTDYRMPPGPNGVDVAGEVARLSPTTRVVLHTNYRDATLVERARAVGAVVVEKGDIRALRARVRSVGEGAHGREG